MKSKLTKKEGRRLSARLLQACAEMTQMLDWGCSAEDHNAKLDQINALTDKLGIKRVPLDRRTGDEPDEFPSLSFTTIDGDRYAEIGGERYKMERINGQPMLSEFQMYEIIERHAPNDEAKVEALQKFRAMASRATGGPGGLQ